MRDVSACTGGLVTVTIPDMLRRYHEVHTGRLTAWRTQSNWEKLVEWQIRPGERLPKDFSSQLLQFLRAGDNRPGSANPWSISTRLFTRIVINPKVKDLRNRRFGYKVQQFSIGRVRTAEEERKWKEDCSKARQFALTQQEQERPAEKFIQVDDF
jgi:hypothetical protein